MGSSQQIIVEMDSTPNFLSYFIKFLIFALPMTVASSLGFTFEVRELVLEKLVLVSTKMFNSITCVVQRPTGILLI